MDVPDRLPYEVAERFWSPEPRLELDHTVQPVQLVFATKPGQSTARPFVRVHPRDLLLYQALADACRPNLEAALGANDQVFAFRMSEIDVDNPFEGSPRWSAFSDCVRQHADANPGSYLIEADVSSFFIGVRTQELERRLLEAGVDGRIVRDLGGLLQAWNAAGVQGLPQGVLASSPLANFYLHPVNSSAAKGCLFGGTWTTFG